MHYFQFNIGDYASHTRHLSLMEDLAYRRMLDTYYLREEPLPESAKDVARLIGMRDQISEVEQVLADFFTLTDDGWAHDRADAEIQHFREKSIKASNAGKASAARRSNRRSTDAEQTFNQPITNNQEPITKDNVNCASSDAPPQPDLLENEAETSNSETVSVSDIIEAWNAVAERIGKPKVQRVSDGRKQVLKARIKQNSIEDFVTVFKNIERSEFLRNWKAMGFDWVFKAGNFQKILEGNYND